MLIVLALIIVLGVLTAIQIRKNKQSEKNINFDEIIDVVSKREKQVIDELFEDCTVFALKTIKQSNIIRAENVFADTFNKGYEVIIFRDELMFHIIALFCAKMQDNIDEFKKMHYVYTILLMKKLREHSQSISYDYVNNIIITRVKQIFKENDFETRNFNFLNLCNTEARASKIIFEKYVDEINPEEILGKITSTVYVTNSDIDKLDISFGNPANMMFLPLAYKSGLIDKYLDKLSNGKIKIE